MECTTHPGMDYHNLICIVYQMIKLANLSHRSSMKYFHSSNGATESRSTANDREGCLRELITREFNGKKYVMEKRQCPGAPPQTTETLVNLTREELPEFFKNWKIDDSPGNKDTF